MDLPVIAVVVIGKFNAFLIFFSLHGETKRCTPISKQQPFPVIICISRKRKDFCATICYSSSVSERKQYFIVFRQDTMYWADWDNDHRKRWPLFLWASKIIPIITTYPPVVDARRIKCVARVFPETLVIFSSKRSNLITNFKIQTHKRTSCIRMNFIEKLVNNILSTNSCAFYNFLLIYFNHFATSASCAAITLSATNCSTILANWWRMSQISR